LGKALAWCLLDGLAGWRGCSAGAWLAATARLLGRRSFGRRRAAAAVAAAV